MISLDILFLGGSTMKSSKRKTRSDKFPLTLHTTGQYCKKIKGRMYYFGSDKKQALEKYLDQATYLHGGKNLIQKASNGNMTLKQLCDFYLQYQRSNQQFGKVHVLSWARSKDKEYFHLGFAALQKKP
jgi:hypothetical protein